MTSDNELTKVDVVDGARAENIPADEIAIGYWYRRIPESMMARTMTEMSAPTTRATRTKKATICPARACLATGGLGTIRSSFRRTA